MWVCTAHQMHGMHCPKKRFSFKTNMLVKLCKLKKRVNDEMSMKAPWFISWGFHSKVLTDGWPELLSPWNEVLLQTERQIVFEFTFVQECFILHKHIKAIFKWHGTLSLEMFCLSPFFKKTKQKQSRMMDCPFLPLKLSFDYIWELSTNINRTLKMLG